MALQDGVRGNRLLKRPDEPIEFSGENVAEFVKCAEDPIYFAENYIKIVHVDKGLVPFVMYDYQREIMTKIHENRRVAVLTARQAGKCFHINTPIELRNKKTGEIVKMTVGEFYEAQKIDKKHDSDKAQGSHKKSD